MIKPGMFISERYEIVESIGSGGMADVYKAVDRRLNRNVAIKFLKAEFADDQSFVDKFRGEAQAAAMLSHPNIVNVYDVGEDSGLYFIVMELVEGITLKKFIERKGQLEIKEAVGIGIQIAHGLECAHEHHIIHRDIKPQNIIISRDGKVKVTDFGIAKAVTANTAINQAIGSVHYLSPEQARGGYSDEKSDIYSLGVTIYEMISGKVPFGGENTVTVALQQIQGEAQPLNELREDVPASVQKIVEKCMQKKPERRYLTVTDLISDLKRSMKEPEGDFVNMPAAIVSDSPTRQMNKDELKTIKTESSKKKISEDEISDEAEPVRAKTSEAAPVAKKKAVATTQTTKKKVNKISKEEDEDIDAMDPRFEKFIIAGTVLLAIALCIALVYLVMRVTGYLGGNTAQTPTTTGYQGFTTAAPTAAPEDLISVPSVEDLSKEDAEKTLRLKSESFTIIWKEDYSATVEAGRVIAQYPPAKRDVARDAEITLTISVGPETKPITDITGMKEEEAIAALEADGFVIHEVEYRPNAEIEAQTVIGTEPEIGTLAKTSDTIKVVVSGGVDGNMVEMPDLSGHTYDEAKSLLEERGLKIGETDFMNSDNYEKNLVCGQSVLKEKMVELGTAVNITLSLGKSEEPTPEPTTTTEATTTTTEATTEEPTTTQEPTNEPEVTTESTEEIIYSYVGSVTINWPESLEGFSSVYAEIYQGDAQAVVYDSGEELDSSSFPLQLAIVEDEDTGFTEGAAVVHVWFGDEEVTYNVVLSAEPAD